METLNLVCAGSYNKRPIKSAEMRHRAAETLVADLIKGNLLEEDDGAADQIVQVTRWGEYDGHRMARELDSRFGWDCDLGLACELDAFDGLLQDIFDAAEKQWATENPHDPQFGSGDTVVWNGTTARIDGICQYRPQCYQVQFGDMRPNSYYVVPFEDVFALSLRFGDV
jgi:hypothetical protein